MQKLSDIILYIVRALQNYRLMMILKNMKNIYLMFNSQNHKNYKHKYNIKKNNQGITAYLSCSTDSVRC